MLLSAIPIGNRIQLETEYNRRVKELAAQGYPVCLEDIENKDLLPKGAKNAADFYVEAFSHYQEPNDFEKEFLPIRGNYNWPDDVPPFPQEVMDALESSLEANRETLRSLDRAALIKRCHWPGKLNRIDYLGINFSNVHLQEFKKSLRLLSERNLYLAQKNMLSELKRSMYTLIALSNSISEQPFELDYLVTSAMRSSVVRNFEKILNQVAFMERDLKRFQKQLRQMQDSDLLYRAMVNERCGLIVFFRLPFSEQKLFLEELWPDIKYLRILATVSGYKQKDKLFLLNDYERYIDVIKLPFKQQYGVLQNIDKTSNKGMFALHIYRHSLTPYSPKICKINIRMMGELKCAETALAVERYRLKYDVLPESLEQLVPEFMEAVPRDPFDGETLRYIKHDVGYTVYAIGDDGVDNDGLSREQMKEKMGGGEPEEFDWPFTVRR